MPITKSAKKAYVSSQRKRVHNVVLEKKITKSLKNVKKENASETISLIDKMAKRHIFSKNKAGRLKSQITKKFGTPKQEKSEKKKEISNKKPAKTKITSKNIKSSSKAKI